MSYTMKADYIFSYSVDNVFEVVTNGIIDQQRQRGIVRNFSYTQPIGTEISYTYERLGQTLTGLFKISGFENNRIFQYTIQTDRLHSTISWRFVRVNKRQTKVIYEEAVSSSDRLTNFQFSALGWMKKRQFKKQARQYFDRLEEQLQIKYGRQKNTA